MYLCGTNMPPLHQITAQCSKYFIYFFVLKNIHVHFVGVFMYYVLSITDLYLTTRCFSDVTIRNSSSTPLTPTWSAGHP
jgi:hypothetical protein